MKARIREGLVDKTDGSINAHFAQSNGNVAGVRFRVAFLDC